MEVREKMGIDIENFNEYNKRVSDIFVKIRLLIINQLVSLAFRLYFRKLFKK